MEEALVLLTHIQDSHDAYHNDIAQNKAAWLKVWQNWSQRVAKAVPQYLYIALLCVAEHDARGGFWSRKAAAGLERRVHDPCHASLLVSLERCLLHDVREVLVHVVEIFIAHVIVSPKGFGRKASGGRCGHKWHSVFGPRD